MVEGISHVSMCVRPSGTATSCTVSAKRRTASGSWTTASTRESTTRRTGSRDWAVQESRSEPAPGPTARRSPGFQDSRSSGVQEFMSPGVQEPGPCSAWHAQHAPFAGSIARAGVRGTPCCALPLGWQRCPHSTMTVMIAMMMVMVVMVMMTIMVVVLLLLLMMMVVIR